MKEMQMKIAMEIYTANRNSAKFVDGIDGFALAWEQAGKFIEFANGKPDLQQIINDKANSYWEGWRSMVLKMRKASFVHTCECSVCVDLRKILRGDL